MRWRFVNAGANHQAFNHMWLGEKTDFTIDYKDKSGKKHTIDVYQSQTMYAVAFDGITTDKKVEVTANTPLLLAPGNRTDVLIKVPVDSDGKEYILFKYYPQDIAVITPGIDISKVNASNVEDYLGWYCPDGRSSKCTYSKGQTPFMAAFQKVTNPYLFGTNNLNKLSGGSYTENFGLFKQLWSNSESPTPLENKISIAPLIKLTEDAQNPGTLNIDFALAGDFPTPEDCFMDNHTCTKGAGKWVPPLDGFGGGAFTPEPLLKIVSDAKLTPIGPANLPSDSQLSNIAVAGSFSGTVPTYVSQFSQEDI